MPSKPPTPNPDYVVRTAGAVKKGDWLYDPYTEKRPEKVLQRSVADLPDGSEPEASSYRVWLRRETTGWQPWHNSEWLYVLTDSAKRSWELAAIFEGAAKAADFDANKARNGRSQALYQGEARAFRKAAAAARGYCDD